MVDINGKEIKAGMCLEIVYDEDSGVGVGVLEEKNGKLGYREFFTKEFVALEDTCMDNIKGFLIIKE
jgi:hypothetical protein